MEILADSTTQSGLVEDERLRSQIVDRVGSCQEVKGGDWRWRTQIVDPRAGHPPPGRRLEIEIGDWRSQLAAAGVKWEIGDRRSEMCGVNESIAHLLEGLSPPPPTAPRIEIGDWRLEMEIGDLTGSGKI